VPEKMIGTLTSSILKSVHTLISPIFSYKLYSVATPGHPEPLPLEIHVRIIALTQRVSGQSPFGRHFLTVRNTPGHFGDSYLSVLFWCSR